MTRERFTHAAVIFAAIVALVLFFLSFIPGLANAAEHRVSARRTDAGISCHVPHDAGNRWLNVGVQGYVSHGMQLDGLASDPTVVDVTLPDFDCEGRHVLEGFCELFYDVKGYERATTNILCQ